MLITVKALTIYDFFVELSNEANIFPSQRRKENGRPNSTPTPILEESAEDKVFGMLTKYVFGLI